MKINFGLGTGRNEPIWQIADTSRLADQLGYKHITFIDSQNLSRDVYSMMSIAALNSHSIHIGHGVTNPFTRHPSVTANSTATVNELSGGRAFIGIGAGMSSLWTMGMGARTQEEFREAVQFFRDYTSGQEAHFQGAVMHSEWIQTPIPLYLAATGPKALQLAGELADGIMVTAVHPEILKWKLEQIELGANRAGRDPSKIDVWARTMCYVADSKEQARREVASYCATNATGMYRSLFTRQSKPLNDLQNRMEKMSPGIINDFKIVSDAYDNYEHERTDAPHGKKVTQRIIDSLMLTGTTEDICDQVSKISETGIKTVSMTLYTIIDKMGMIKEISDKIMPYFRN